MATRMIGNRKVWDPEEEEELALLTGVLRGPAYPLVPVKNHTLRDKDGWPEHGIFVQPGQLKDNLGLPKEGIRVYMLEIFTITSTDDILHAKYTDFPTVEEFVNAGWMID
jgi:hypothetical protein